MRKDQEAIVAPENVAGELEAFDAVARPGARPCPFDPDRSPPEASCRSGEVPQDAADRRDVGTGSDHNSVKVKGVHLVRLDHESPDWRDPIDVTAYSGAEPIGVAPGEVLQVRAEADRRRKYIGSRRKSSEHYRC